MKMGTGSEMGIAAEVIRLRYFYAPEMGPSALKAGLLKAKGVEKVDFEESTKSVLVTYSGALKGLPALEQAAAASGVTAAIVSHARLVVNFKSEKGADLKALDEAIKGLEGVKTSKLMNATAELYVNLEAFQYDALAAAAESAKFKAIMGTHEYVTLKSEGDAASLEKELSITRGVLVIRSDAEGLHLWTVKKVADATFKKAAEKVSTAISEIVRR